MNTKEDFIFPAKINAQNYEIEFIRTNMSELKKLPFHDLRLNQNKDIVRSKKIDMIQSKSESKSVSYIFHTAFCGSTFLSRLLGEKYFSIREPNILMNLASILRVNQSYKNDKKEFNALLEKVLSSLLNIQKNTLIKTTNACNNIILNLLEVAPNSRALLLYTSLEDFIISILKKGEAGKSFIRNLYNVFSLDGSPYAMTDFRKVNCFTDLQITCLVWSMQMHVYQQLTHSKYSARIRFMEANTLLNNPKSVVKKIAKYFGEELKEPDIENLENMGLFSSHSKNKTQKYSSKTREKEKKQIKKKYHIELEEIDFWIKTSLKHTLLPSFDLHFKI